MVQVNNQNWPLGQIGGTLTNDAAIAGNVGELLTGTAAGVSLSTSTGKTVTSVSLTPGDWDVRGVVKFIPAVTTSFNQLITEISTVDNTTTSGVAVSSSIGYGAVVTGGRVTAITTPTCRISLAATTTIYLVALAEFTASTLTADGFISARRKR